MNMLYEGMTGFPGEIEQAGMRFHNAIEDIVQFKTHEFFISGTSYLVFFF
jgi:hypothetical protein